VRGVSRQLRRRLVHMQLPPSHVWPIPHTVHAPPTTPQAMGSARPETHTPAVRQWPAQEFAQLPLLHESVVNEFPSSQSAHAPPPAPQAAGVVPATQPRALVHVVHAFVQVPPEHESVVKLFMSSQLLGSPEHVPALQASLVVQASPSLQLTVLLLCVHAPLDVLQPSLVHTLLSLQFFGDPLAQEPEAHRSLSVQALPSSQLAVLLV